MQQQLVMKNPCDAYLKQRVMTASPMELILMLYDALKKNLLLAEKSLQKGEFEAAHNKLIRGQEIVCELLNSLDMNYELSENLMDVYEFLLHSMALINTNKKAEDIPGLVEIVESLREAWQEVADKTKGAVSLEG